MLNFLRHLKRKLRLIRNQRLAARFGGQHCGQRCFIIGNGPSLCINDLERLQGELSFAANKIYLCFNQTVWRPSYYVAEDDKIIKNNLCEINKIKEPVKLLRHLDSVRYSNNGKIINFDMYFPNQSNYPQFTKNATMPLACGYTVTYVALQWAFYMGFSRVYLLGLDFNYPGLKYNSDGTVELPDNGTHFSANYGNPGEKFWAPRLDDNLKAFKMAKDVFEADGRKIFNATRGGKLEVFERVDFDSLF